jgi:GINS complex subunit 3
MNNNYYSIEAICAEETLVPAILPHGCTGVGAIIDQSSDQPQLAPGASVDLPLWMMADLARRNLALPELPIIYGEKMRRKIKAGAGCEDLRARCPFYYTVAEQLHSIMTATGCADESLPGYMASALRGRYRELLTRAPQVEGSVEATQIRGKLSVEEAALFSAASEAAGAHDRWRCNKEVPLMNGAGMRGNRGLGNNNINKIGGGGGKRVKRH